jgi:hypothetical protein
MIWQYRLADCCNGRDGVEASEAVRGLLVKMQFHSFTPFRRKQAGIEIEPLASKKSGVGNGNRTRNRRSHSPVLCQLSYSHRLSDYSNCSSGVSEFADAWWLS